MRVARFWYDAVIVGDVGSPLFAPGDRVWVAKTHAQAHEWFVCAHGADELHIFRGGLQRQAPMAPAAFTIISLADYAAVERLEQLSASIALVDLPPGASEAFHAPG